MTITTKNTKEPQPDAPVEGPSPRRRGAWRQRLLYVSAMVVFGAALWWTGRSGTHTVAAFRRQIELVLKATERGLQCERLDDTTLLVTGPDVVSILDVAPLWNRYRSGTIGSAHEAAASVTADIRSNRASLAALLADEARVGRLVGLSMPLRALHPRLTEAQASSALSVISVADLPFFIHYLDTDRLDSRGRPMLVPIPQAIDPLTETIGNRVELPLSRREILGLALMEEATKVADTYDLGSLNPFGPANSEAAMFEERRAGPPGRPILANLVSKPFLEKLSAQAAGRPLTIVALSAWDVAVVPRPVTDAEIVSWGKSGVASDDTRWDVAAVFALQDTTLRFERLVSLDKGAAPRK